MPLLHDPAVRSKLESRIRALRQDATRAWGSMTAGQMLWHVNQFLGFALGDDTPAPQKMPMPLPVVRFFLLYMPWPKGAPTHPSAVAKTPCDFEVERAKCLRLIERFANKPIDGPWADDPVFRSKGGTFKSKLQAKHLDHHLRQFGC